MTPPPAAAATVPSAPGPATTGPGPGGITDGTDITLTWAEFTAEARQAERTGLCSCPVRLRGRIDAIDLATGELRPVYDTAAEPGGVLLTACGNRRETVCSACSAVYKLRDLMARMGHDSEWVALIYQHESHGADLAITDAIDRHVQAEQADDQGDDGQAGALAPVG